LKQMARGRWQGGEFDTGHRENGLLATINWFGKTFISATDAKPLICLDADGNKYANTDNGEASLSMAEFRGEVTATMVFDGQPVHDHFKKIDDNAVMGIMNGKNASTTAATRTSTSNGSSPTQRRRCRGGILLGVNVISRPGVKNRRPGIKAGV
jgi:hypothetical protein